jgi:hypothetical protein
MSDYNYQPQSQNTPTRPFDPASTQPPAGQPYPSQPGYPPAPGAPAYPQRLQPGYGQPYPGYTGYAPAPEHPQGTIILVLGLLGLVVPPIGVAAWIMGSKTEKEIAASGVAYSNTGSIKAGKILGIVFTCLTAVGILFTILWVLIWVVMMGSMMAQMP